MVIARSDIRGLLDGVGPPSLPFLLPLSSFFSSCSPHSSTSVCYTASHLLLCEASLSFIAPHFCSLSFSPIDNYIFLIHILLLVWVILSFVSGIWTLFLICLFMGLSLVLYHLHPSLLVCPCVLPLNLPSGELHPTTLPVWFINVCITLVNMLENIFEMGIYVFYM